MKAFPLIAAALGGALVGAAAALLLAPQSGSETRDAIRDFIKSHVPNIKERDLNELADQIAEEIKDVKYIMRGFATFLLGALVGAGAAALLTPTTGPELRDRIRLILQKRGILPTARVDELVEIIASEVEKNK